MPLIRFIYPPDIRTWGDGPVVVEDVQARVLTEMRRAVLVTEDDLAELKKAELADLADEVGAEVDPKATKAGLVEAISKPKAE